MPITYKIGLLASSLYTITPGADIEIGREQERSDHRALTGALRMLVWYDYPVYKIPLVHLPGSLAAVVNSWQITGAPVQFWINSNVTSCRIMNEDMPIVERAETFDCTRYSGTLELEGY